MTILPKKKQTKEKGEAEKTTDHQHSPHSPSSETRAGTRRPNSPPPRWNSPPPVELLEERLPSHVDPGGLFEEYSPHEGTSNHNKRRHRSSPHRNVRKHRHDRLERSNASVSQWEMGHPSTLNVGASSSGLPHRHTSFRPVASTSTDRNAELEDLNNEVPEEDLGGYNSGDEYAGRPVDRKENIEELERCFETTLQEKRGFIIKKMGEDGACLFRAVADQIYGDQEMHGCVRKNCVDYMAQNIDYFKAYVTEDFNLYLSRKRLDHCHGNNVEMQAMCELYNRPIEVYQYSTEPINTFQTTYKSEYEPIRLSYHQNMHYNSVINPYKASIGVGLGLPGYQPGLAEKNQMKDAKRVSEDFHIEKAMLEDKLRETDWEVTQESLEEQVARESYLQWLRDQEKAANRQTTSTARSASATCSTASDAAHSQWWEEPAARGSHSPRNLGSSSPPAQGLSQASMEVTVEGSANKAGSPKQLLPGGGHSPGVQGASPHTGLTLREGSASPGHMPPQSEGGAMGGARAFSETASLMDELPPQLYGLADWDDDDIMAQVMAQSQQEYLDNLKRTAGHTSSSPPTSSSSHPQPPSPQPSHHGNHSPEQSTS